MCAILTGKTTQGETAFLIDTLLSPGKLLAFYTIKQEEEKKEGKEATIQCLMELILTKYNFTDIFS